MNKATVMTKNPDAAFRRLQAGQGAVVLLLDSGEYHGLNDVGAAIWNLIDGARTIDAIVDELHGQLTDPPSNLHAIVESFVAELGERRLVRA